jgi:precorrin-6A/cobalt-precorrin-6A reductase
MIWLIGGTSDGNNLGRMLLADGYKVLISVTTAYGSNLAAETGALVREGVLDTEKMAHLIYTNQIIMVIDASHPFAGKVSENAMITTAKAGIPYFRYERPVKQYEQAVYADDYDSAINYLATVDGNILLTTGSKNIYKFAVLNSSRLYARVLSTSESLVQCEKAGIKPDHIIAVKGVPSVAFNMALFKEYHIRHLVTKDSGDEGGMNEKMEAAKLSDVNVLVIKRPKIDYPEIFSDYNSLLNRVKEVLTR